MHNAPEAFAQLRRREPAFRTDPKNPLARVAVTKRVLHYSDIRTEAAYLEGEPAHRRLVRPCGRSNATYRATAKIRPPSRHD